MKLVVDKFKRSGKWIDTLETPVTIAQLDEFGYCFNPIKCVQLFERLSGHSLPRNNPEYSVFIRLEEQDRESQHFIRYLLVGVPT